MQPRIVSLSDVMKLPNHCMMSIPQGPGTIVLSTQHVIPFGFAGTSERITLFVANFFTVGISLGIKAIVFGTPESFLLIVVTNKGSETL